MTDETNTSPLAKGIRVIASVNPFACWIIAFGGTAGSSREMPVQIEIVLI